MKSRLFSLLAAICLMVLIAALLPAPEVSAAAVSADTFYYDQLNARQKELYVFLKNYYDGLSDKPGVYEINLTHLLPANPTADDYSSLLADCHYADMAVAEDYPMYDQKSFIRGAGWADPGDTPRFVLDIIRTNLVTADVQKRVDARIKQLVAIAGTGDRYTQLRRLTHYLIENSFYDPYLHYLNGEGHYDYALATRGHFYNQSVYGLLLEGIAICDGFSQTFKVLCNELNIPCIIMSNVGHAWNLVQMEDGKWYRVDLTNACRVGWDAELPQTIDAYFNEIFLNNNTLIAAFGAYDNPYMLSLNNVALVTEFPEHADGQYQYTGGTTDFSYTVAASTYSPGSGKFSYRVNDDGKTCTVTNYEGKESGDLTIPGKLDGYTVTAIDGYAFYYCTGFTGKLTIPDTVESIGKGAFAGCYNLTSVKLPANLHSIGNGAFMGCKKLTEVTLPDLVGEVGDFVFFDCNNLRSISFGSHIQSIGEGAFDNLAAGATLKGPAGSVVQQRASEAGITFQASGSLCAMHDTDGKWEYEGNQHFHTCTHGGRFDYQTHTGMYCGWKCADCGAEYCGIKVVYRESVITLVDAQPATCTSLEYTGDKMCVCGNLIEYGDWVGEWADHAPVDGSWTCEGAIHYQACACGYQLNVATHSGGTATATQRAKCSVCGAEYGELDPTNTNTVPDQGNSGGNTSGGNTSGGNTSGGNTSGGNTSGGNTSGGSDAPTTGTDPAGTDPSSGATAPTGDSGSASDPSGTQSATSPSSPVDSSQGGEPEPTSPVVAVVLITVGVCLAGAGGWFGYQFWRKKKQQDP